MIRPKSPSTDEKISMIKIFTNLSYRQHFAEHHRL